MNDCKPGCTNHCRQNYETRPLAPRKTAQNLKDGFMKCLNCVVWLKISRTTKACPCCADKLRSIGRSKKVEKKRVD